MKINFIDLQAQYLEYQTEIDQEVLEVFSSAQFIGGEKLNRLENSLATYTGASTQSAVAVEQMLFYLLLWL